MDTDDIKAVLVEHFKGQGISTQASGWKRLSKKKDEQGRPLREFSCASVGTVQVIEDQGGLIISDANASPVAVAGKPASASHTSGFTIPEFSEESRRAAERVHLTYLAMAEGEGPYEDMDIDAAEEIRKIPEFALALPALGTRLAFMFPMETYGNDEMEPGTTLDSPVGELCVSILDPHPDAEHDLYAWSILCEEMPGFGLDSMDEYHFEFRNKKQTVRQAVQRLLDVGFEYDFRSAKDKEQGCVFYKQLKDLIPKRAPLPPASGSRPRV